MGAVIMTGSAMLEKPPASGKIFRIRQIRNHISGDYYADGGRTRQEIESLADYIRIRNKPYLPFSLLEIIGIAVTDIHWKPVCEKCWRKLKRITERRWKCQCQWETVDPYTRTLERWFLLRSPSVTNEQVRELFGISQTAAANLLKQISVTEGRPRIGDTVHMGLQRAVEADKKVKVMIGRTRMTNSATRVTMRPRPYAKKIRHMAGSFRFIIAHPTPCPVFSRVHGYRRPASSGFAA